MTKKICISGYYGFDNFGDETILKILTENLKSFECSPEITVFSSNPEKTASNLNVKSIQTFNIKDVLKTIIKTDCLISGGGSLLQDATSLKSLVYYLGVIAAAVFFRKKIIVFAQGIGPVNNKFFAALTAFLLKKAALVTVRDDNSLKLLNKWSVNSIKCSDPVWNLSLKKSTASAGKIGIQLRDFHNVNNTFIKKLALCVNQYYKDKEIVILSLQNKLDLEICQKFQNILEEINPDIKAEIIENTSNDKIIEDICNLDELIAMRYHACLIAIKANVKLLPISYDIKVETLAKEFNLEYIDINRQENIENIFKSYTENNIIYDEEKINTLKFNFKLIESII